jgi:hypothetical protein
VGLTTLSCKNENCWEASKKFSRILWRRPRPTLGYGAKEKKKELNYRSSLFEKLMVSELVQKSPTFL